MEKSENVDFLGSFEAYDLKVGRYRQHVEPVTFYEFKGHGHFLTLAKGQLQIKC